MLSHKIKEWQFSPTCGPLGQLQLKPPCPVHGTGTCRGGAGLQAGFWAGLGHTPPSRTKYLIPSKGH